MKTSVRLPWPSVAIRRRPVGAVDALELTGDVVGVIPVPLAPVQRVLHQRGQVPIQIVGGENGGRSAPLEGTAAVERGHGELHTGAGKDGVEFRPI